MLEDQPEENPEIGEIVQLGMAVADPYGGVMAVLRQALEVAIEHRDEMSHGEWERLAWIAHMAADLDPEWVTESINLLIIDAAHNHQP